MSKSTRTCLLLAVSSNLISYHPALAIFRPPSEAGTYDFVLEQVQPHINNVVTKARDLQVVSEKDEAVLQSMDVCGGFQLIADQIPNGEEDCQCINGSQIQCSLSGACSEDRSICTDRVGLSFQFLVQDQQVNRLKLSACFTYAAEFAATCIETIIAPNQQLEACNSATYGGEECLCNVCNDNKSLSLDCTEHHPQASSGGCYLLSEAIPALSKFDESPQNGRRRATEEQAQNSSGTQTMMTDSMYGVVALCAGLTIVAGIL